MFWGHYSNLSIYMNLIRWAKPPVGGGGGIGALHPSPGSSKPLASSGGCGGRETTSVLKLE